MGKLQKHQKIIILSAVIIAVLTAIFTAIFFYLRNSVVFELNGESTVIELGEIYEDAGTKAEILGRDLSDKVETDNPVDTKTTGTYAVTYRLNFLGRSHELSRTVTVVDNIPPSISLNGESEVKIYIGDEYNDDGATASDNYDGDLTDKIAISGEVDLKTAGEYTLTYSIKDSSGNESSISRKVIVEQKPVASRQTVAAPSTSPLSEDELTRYIQTKGYDVAVGYYNLSTGRQYLYQPDRIIYGASLIKTLDAVYLYDHGLATENLKSDISRAISVSDNAAHIRLVDAIGRENLKSYGQNLGASTTLNDEGTYFCDTTVRDQLTYWRKLWSLGNSELNSYFRNNNSNYIRISGFNSLHKYGYYGQQFHDAGIILDSQPYIVVILTNHGASAGPSVIRDLSTMIYRLHKS